MINMRKKLKKYGSALVNSYSPEEQEIYKLKEGQIIDITITNIQEPESQIPIKENFKNKKEKTK